MKAGRVFLYPFLVCLLGADGLFLCPKYWNSGGLLGATEKQEERENQIPLTFLASHFIAEWTERENFFDVG